MTRDSQGEKGPFLLGLGMSGKARETCIGQGEIQGLYRLWKVMDVDSAIFQDLESFAKRRFFNMAMKNFWIFVLKILKYPKMDSIS